MRITNLPVILNGLNKSVSEMFRVKTTVYDQKFSADGSLKEAKRERYEHIRNLLEPRDEPVVGPDGEVTDPAGGVPIYPILAWNRGKMENVDELKKRAVSMEDNTIFIMNENVDPPVNERIEAFGVWSKLKLNYLLLMDSLIDISVAELTIVAGVLERNLNQIKYNFYGIDLDYDVKWLGIENLVLAFTDSERRSLEFSCEVSGQFYYTGDVSDAQVVEQFSLTVEELYTNGESAVVDESTIIVEYTD